jgi:hypothetical protein
VLAGICQGLALGSKYLALGGAAALGGWLVLRSLHLGWRAMLRSALLFGGTALLVASPWYLRNLAWTGNPLYPLLFTPQDWSAERVALWTEYMRGFGVGQGVLDYLLLPLNLFLHHERYVSFMGSIEIPSPLFLLVFLLPFLHPSRPLRWLLEISGLMFAVWALGAQQTRFLLPIFPALSLLSSAVLLELARWRLLKRTGPALARGLAAGMLAVTLVYALIYALMIQPWRPLLGLEGRADFLRRIVRDYPGLETARRVLPADAGVLMLWDGRGYYTDERFTPDIDHSQWTELVMAHPSVDELAAALRQRGVTHLFFSLEDADFILQHDPAGHHRRAAEFLLKQFRPACTRSLYRDEWVELLEVTC